MKHFDLRIRYPGHFLDLRLTRDALTVRGCDVASLPITSCVDGEVWAFGKGTTRVVRVNDDATHGVDAP